MPTFVVIFSSHELKFQQLSQTLISRPVNCYLQLCKSKMPNFLLMSQTGVWVRSLPSSAMTSKRSSSSESLATFRLAKLSSFEQLHPPYGLPSLHFIFKQQCHISLVTRRYTWKTTCSSRLFLYSNIVHGNMQ